MYKLLLSSSERKSVNTAIKIKNIQKGHEKEYTQTNIVDIYNNEH